MKTCIAIQPSRVQAASGRRPLLATFAVVLTLVAGSIATRAEVLAHWTFDESSGTVVHDSAGSYNGILSPGGAAFVSGGISGSALSLSRAANGFVNMGNVLGLTTGDFSIVAWIKMSSGDRTEDSGILGKHAAYTRNGFFLNANMTGGALVSDKAAFYQGGTGIAQVTIAETPISSTSVNDGSWHQVVAVYQAGGSKAIYVDGAPAEDSKPSQPFVGNSVAFLIGGVNFGGVPTGLFTGLIDDVQIYNNALSDDEVDFLFRYPGQVVGTNPELPPAGVVAHWAFDESSGAVAHDSAGSINGNLSPGGATFVAGGISGSALSLDQAGGGFVNMGNVLGFTDQPFSIVAWIKTAPGYSVSDSAVVSKHAAFTANGYWFMANQAGGGGQVGKVIFGEGTAARSVTSTTTVNDGNWHQIVSTWQPGGGMLVYVDGTPAEAVRNASLSLAANSVAFLIGAVNLGDVIDPRFTGLIDDVQIYNYALSEGEVDFLFQHPGQVAGLTDCAQQVDLLRVQLAAANATNAALQAELTRGHDALVAAHANLQDLQSDMLDLLQPLQLLTQEFRMTFGDPHFRIRGETAVDQTQNLVAEILDLPRGQQQQLYINLGGHRGKARQVEPPARPQRLPDAR